MDTLLEYKSVWDVNRYITIDNFLDNDLALSIQNEILHIPKTEWDRYENPLEQKNTLRNKYNLPPLTDNLFSQLNSLAFLEELSQLSGFNIMEDKSRNWWGIHTFNNGDKLDIHVDAGRHPINGFKKIITLGIYLSYKWKSENGGYLEFWKGSNATDANPFLEYCITRIEPKFNRLIIFECNDYAWHGAPEPCICNDDEIRIFLTCSYLADIDITNTDNNFKTNLTDLTRITNLNNNRKKAFFIGLPGEIPNAKIQEIRLMRSDENKYKEIYKYNINHT